MVVSPIWTWSSPRHPLRSHYLVHNEKILLCRNRTNSWCRAHIYISTCFFPLYVVSKIGLINIRYFSNTHLFPNVVIMTLNYVLCPILVQNPGKCTFWRYMSISPSSTHSNNQRHHLTTLPLHHLHIEKFERWGSIRGRKIVVREIVTMI